MPADANPNGDIFGGWIMAQMDLAGAVLAVRRAKGRVATVAVDAMSFHRPVYVGDLVSCYATITRVGRRSEEHTSELQSLMRISYAVFCLKNKTRKQLTNRTNQLRD